MSGLPSPERVAEWVVENPDLSSVRDIAAAFGVKGRDRAELRRMVREMEGDGRIDRAERRRDSGGLPPVGVLAIRGHSPDGGVIAVPIAWRGEGPAPSIVLRGGRAASLGEGDRVLARISRSGDGERDWEASVIHRIASAPRPELGVFRKHKRGGSVMPADKRRRGWWTVPDGQSGGAKDGELVEVRPLDAGHRGDGPSPARIVSRHGAGAGMSAIAIREHGIPQDFSAKALAEAEGLGTADMDGREDLTDLPLATIDPPDARDHDDAVWAHPDGEADNPGGFVVWVAIADVSHYVRPGGAIDAEARRRGNSTYFPDRVVPMLPERLSADLCSLRSGAVRPCVAVRMRIGADGEMVERRFVRGLMKSVASLNYREVQDAIDGRPSERCAPLMERVVRPLFEAYAALAAARERRQPLDLDIPERRVRVGDSGKVLSVGREERLESHRLIEEFMILANVAAAQTLAQRGAPLLYRVHEKPTAEKTSALRRFVLSQGLKAPRGRQASTESLNGLIEQAAQAGAAEAVGMSVLRSMAQARYTPANCGHFGLALDAYAHFTSPIRRYADLLVHRALAAAHGWEGGGAAPGAQDDHGLAEAGEWLSQTERRSACAERDTLDRYLAQHLSKRVGRAFEGRISGVASFGAFVCLDETGAHGLLHVRDLGYEYFEFDRAAGELVGEQTGAAVRAGMRVRVRLEEAEPVSGALRFGLLDIEAAQSSGRRRRRGRGRGGR